MHTHAAPTVSLATISAPAFSCQLCRVSYPTQIPAPALQTHPSGLDSVAIKPERVRGAQLLFPSEATTVAQQFIHEYIHFTIHALTMDESARQRSAREANRIHCRETRERKRQRERLLREVMICGWVLPR